MSEIGEKIEGESNILEQTKIFMKKNNLTNLLGKKSKDEIPFVFPLALIHEKSFQTCSQMNRYEKLTQTFLNLRYRIENDEEKEIWFIREVIIK